jgi:hypothetical protein
LLAELSIRRELRHRSHIRAFANIRHKILFSCELSHPHCLHVPHPFGSRFVIVLRNKYYIADVVKRNLIAIEKIFK